MSKHVDPIVPHILDIATQVHPWRLAACVRVAAVYHTPTTVRLADSMTRHQHQIWCIADDAAWERVEARRATLQAALDALADGLRQLGSYASRLAAAGGIATAPDPLAPTVIFMADPDLTTDGYFISDPVPRIARESIASHTPKMLRIERDGAAWGTTHQRDHFVCPDDAAWDRIAALRSAVQEQADAWRRLLRELGTYDTALADGRYGESRKQKAESGKEKTMPTTAAATAPPPRDAWHNLPPLLAGWTWKTNARNESILVAPDGWETKAYQYSNKAISEALRRVNSAPKAAVRPALGPGQPEPEPWPDPPDGWRWNRRGVPAHLIAPDGGWKTANYNDPQRALTEAQQHIELDSARWRLIAAGYDVQPQGMHWVVRNNGSDATMLKSAELIELASDLPAPAALVAAGPSAIVGVVMMDEAEARESIEYMRGDLDQVDTSISSFRQRALVFKEREGWRALKYGGFIEAIRGELGADYSKSYLSRLLDAAEIERVLELPIGNSVPESQLRPLGALETPADQRAAWERAGQIASPGPRTAKHVQQAVDEARPIPDDDHIQAAHTILAKLDQWAESARPGQLKEAYAHARQVRELAKRDGLFHDIDRAMDGTKEPAPAPAPEAEKTITITTDKGPHTVTPIRRVKDLALHLSVGTPPDPADAWTITYVPTGARVGKGFAALGQAEAAFGELSKLDWSGIQGTFIPPTLVEKARAILARYAVPQEAAPAQAAQIEPPPAPPLDPRAAAVAWLSRMHTTLASCPDSTMFRLSEMQEAVAHIEALLNLAESGAAPMLAEVEA